MWIFFNKLPSFFFFWDNGTRDAICNLNIHHNLSTWRPWGEVFPKMSNHALKLPPSGMTFHLCKVLFSWLSPLQIIPRTILQPTMNNSLFTFSVGPKNNSCKNIIGAITLAYGFQKSIVTTWECTNTKQPSKPKSKLNHILRRYRNKCTVWACMLSDVSR